jgi:hypothetical protein
MGTMNWGKKKLELLNVVKVEFLGEQDGIPERDFKARILDLLDQYGAGEAYLARVRYPDGQPSVVLCLGDGISQKQRLLEEIGARFSARFRPDVHLDILLLAPEQTQQVRLVCKPFFVRMKR